MNQSQRFRAQKKALMEELSTRAQLKNFTRLSPVLKRLAVLSDETLIALWQECGLGSPHALVAVGGYGRGELFPYSDVDVLVLLAEQDSEQMQQTQSAIEKFIGMCWDCGLEIGSSVRTTQECLQEARGDITIQTTLLESRLIVGESHLYENFTQQFSQEIDAKAFFVAKTLEMRQRHIKFENTPYSLEPNCKESPGGLRDLQLLLWLSKAAKLGNTWDELEKNGLSTKLEIQKIKRNEAFLNLIRTRLHLAANRREDRLVFDLQAQVANDLNLKPGVAKERLTRASSEALMKQYYWCAKAVTQLSQIVFLNIEERLNPNHISHIPRPINEHFSEKAGMLEINDESIYRTHPHTILETFLLYQNSVGIQGLSAKTLRALYHARTVMDAKFRKDPQNHATFMSILKQPEGITHAFRLMNQTSVLGCYLWVFRRIVGQMQHDLFHVYTVDQHILMVLRNVRRFFIVEHAHEYPYCSQLASSWDKPWILYTAALFHDIAKGRGGDHSELGKRDVKTFCKVHGIEKADAELIEFLVSEHLVMSQIAQKQDLSDPDVIQAFAKKVKDERHLTALYLLTVADIRGTSPKVWNAWKGKLLEDLYKFTRKALGGHAPDAMAILETRKQEALNLLSLYALPFESHKALWDTLDVGYFMRHEPSDIAWHTRQLSRDLTQVIKKFGEPVCFVRARLSAVGEGLQVMVYTPDQTDLFARICGYFDQSGFSILDAKVHTTQNNYALDTFQVASPDVEERYSELIGMIETELTDILQKVKPLPKPSKGRVSRRVKMFPITPRVTLTPDEKAQRWLLNISASDRLGLLYSVALILAKHHVNLLLAKVSTLGERVEDTFLIDGSELQHNKTQIEIETELLEALSF